VPCSVCVCVCVLVVTKCPQKDVNILDLSGEIFGPHEVNSLEMFFFCLFFFVVFLEMLKCRRFCVMGKFSVKIENI